MCGIAGYVSLNRSAVHQEKIERMVVALRHRGPDAQTVHLDGPVGLGHARLSIIDLAGGHQPLFNEDRSISVVCNGEIYNYRELRNRLVQAGHRFRTGSDCEVLPHLWEDVGPNLVDHLRGMFAFVLYDRNKNIVFGARDHFGQKPLYYHHSSMGFSFASEIKGLLVLPEVSREMDPIALDQFLFHQFVPQPRTLFAGVKKLPAGCCFELCLPPSGEIVTPSFESETNDPPNLGRDPAQQETHSGGFESASQGHDSSFKIHRYWQPAFAPDESISASEHLNRVELALTDAVQSHMVADVPVGVFLSGGIDSSLITALAAKFNPQPIETFSISFPGSEHDEGPHARAVAEALGTKHRDFPFEPANLKQMLTHAATLFDQPLADAAVLPLMALSRAAADAVKVVLTGDGGDELFAGYRKYQRMAGFPGRIRWLTDVSRRLFPIRALAACRSDLLGIRKLRTRLAMLIAPSCRSEYHRQGWEGWERFSLYQTDLTEAIGGRFDSLRETGDPSGSRLSPLNLALQLDQGTILADRLLLKGDSATMAYGLEARAPLLDHQLAAVAGALPIELKVTTSRTKVALREIASRYLPADVIARRKKGFSMPLDRWYRHELRDWTRKCLLEESVSLSRLFQRATIERLLSEHAAGKNHSGRIHTLVMLELWCRNFAP